MKHYILVRWRQREGETRRTLVNLHKIVTVVDSVQGCKIHFQGYCLDVGDSFEDVCGMIEAAEAEGSRKPGDRPLMGTAARERQGEAAPKQRDKAPQETAEAAVARSIKEASMPLLSAQTHFPREPWPWASSEDNSECSADLRELVRNLADGGWAPTAQQPPVTAPAAAGESGPAFRISGKDLSRMWHILGRLQGVLEASAEAGRPGEVMRDACDELEIILFGIRPEEDPSREGIHPSESSSGCKPGT